MTNKEKSSRTCLITSGVLLVLGTAILSPEAGIMVLLLSLLFAIAGLCLGYKRYGKVAIVLIIVSVALTIWIFPEARANYNLYLEKVNERSLKKQ